MTLAFAPAVRTQRKLRLALEGPAGSGKTLTALLIARGIANGGKIALLDTEHGSGSIYANDPAYGELKYDALALDEYKPQLCIEAVRLAAQSGYSVLIIDSLSHFWQGKGGVLDQVNARPGNSFTEGWGKVGTPLQNSLIETIIGSPLHVIVTLRTKSEYVVEKNEHGKSVPKRVGLAAIQRDGVEYEFDIVGLMSLENRMTIEKTRMSSLAGSTIDRPDSELGAAILLWLNGGAPEAPKPNPEPVAPNGHVEPSKPKPEMDGTAEINRILAQIKPYGEQHRDEIVQMVENYHGPGAKTKDCTIEELCAILIALQDAEKGDEAAQEGPQPEPEAEEPEPEAEAESRPSVADMRKALRKVNKAQKALMATWIQENDPQWQSLDEMPDEQAALMYAAVFELKPKPETETEDGGTF